MIDIACFSSGDISRVGFLFGNTLSHARAITFSETVFFGRSTARCCSRTQSRSSSLLIDTRELVPLDIVTDSKPLSTAMSVIRARCSSGPLTHVAVGRWNLSSKKGSSVTPTSVLDELTCHLYSVVNLSHQQLCALRVLREWVRCGEGLCQALECLIRE